MFTRTTSSASSRTRTLGFAAALAVAAGVAPALAQPGCYQITRMNSKHQFTFGALANWSSVKGSWYSHVWYKYPDPVNPAQGAQWSPGFFLPNDPPAQAAGFHQFGVDTVINGAPVNYCGANPAFPVFGGCWGYASPVPAALGTFWIPQGGTPMTQGTIGGWVFKGLSIPANPVANALCEFYVSPYGPQTVMTGEMRNNVAFGIDPCIGTPGDMTYAFAFSQLDVYGVLVPPVAPPPPAPPPVTPPFVVSYAISINALNLGGAMFTPGAGIPPGAPTTTTARIYDPIKYHARNQVTGQAVSGTPFDAVVDLGLGSEIILDNGNLFLSGSDADVFITLADPRMSNPGTYTVRVRNGMVVDSSATGYFAVVPAPPVGTVTPFNFPCHTMINFDLDFTSLGNDPIDFSASMSGGGVEPREPLTCVEFTQQPQDVTVCPGNSVTFGAQGQGIGPLSYQWWKWDGVSWTMLLDGWSASGSQLSGCHTDQLTISGANPWDAGTYQCMLVGGCGNATSRGAALTVQPCGPAPCYANCDGSVVQPVLNVGDFTCFLQRYAQNDPYANCDGSASAPTLNVADFTCYLQKFAIGCP